MQCYNLSIFNLIQQYIYLSCMNTPHLVEDKFLIKLILKHKIKGMLKVWKKRSKNSKQRYYKLKQWSYTQTTYLEKLKVMRDQIKKPLRESGMIEEYEQTMIFANLQSMIQLSIEMQTNIDNLLKTWNPITTLLAPTVQSLSIYLKIYKEYSNNYKKADNLIQTLKKDPRFKDVVKVMNVEDYLIKPVQRPLQYKLFVTDYIKLLPPHHADKENLQKALKTLLKIADEINEYVQKQLRTEKMITLENAFGNLIQSTRQYRCQFDAFHTDFNCRVYVFNDLLLIVKLWSEDKQQKYTYMYLCGASYIIRQPDNKTFKNRLYICGSFESIHLTFRDAEDANNAYNIIQQLISVLYQKQYNRTQLLSQMKIKRETMVMNRHSLSNDYKWKEQYQYRMKLRIQVIGVEKRLYEKQWRIVYAIKIQLGRPQTIYYIVFYEIDELKELERYIREVYDKINIPSLDTKLKGMNYDDFKTDFTKYFEFKSILIEDFLNSCLRNKAICKKPQFIAFKLRIPESLWDYLNRFSLICGCEACLHNENHISMEEYKKQQQRIRKHQFQYCIINAFQCQKSLAEVVKLPEFKKMSLEEKLIWAVCKQKRIDYGLQNRSLFGKRIYFHVYIKLVGEQSQIFIENATINDTCRQIVQQVCFTKGIEQNQDFYLVYVHGKHAYYLDNDQYVYDAVKHLEEDYRKIESQKRISINNRQSVFTNFRSMDNFGELFNDFSIADEPKLYIRKVMNLGSALEEKSCQKNPQRYPPIMGQFLRKFQEQYLLLSIQEMKLFCSLFYGVEEFNTIIFSKKIFCNEEKLKKYLPESKWSLISEQFMEKMKQIIQIQVKPCGNILQLYKIILTQFGQKIGWITQFFQVQNLIPQLLGVKQKEVLIGVNQHKVIVTRKFNTVSLLQFPLIKFQYRISGDMLFIDTEGKQYKFIGNNWIFFQNLVQKYKVIQVMETSGNI